MEWLLLLILSSVATGAIAYFLKEEPTILKEKEPKKEPDIKESQPKPSIPEVKQKISFKIDKEDIQKFKDFVEGMPTPIQPEVHQTQDLKEEVNKIKREILRKKKPLKVTYTTDQIIPRTSPFSRHRRPLLNAEKFVEEQKAKEALTIYERLEKRIPDEEIKQKIRKNIEDIKNWLLGIEEEEPIEFPEIIIPLNTQVFALEQFNEGLRKISEDIAKEVSKILADGINQIKGEFKNKEKEVGMGIHTEKVGGDITKSGDENFTNVGVRELNRGFEKKKEEGSGIQIEKIEGGLQIGSYIVKEDLKEKEIKETSKDKKVSGAEYSHLEKIGGDISKLEDSSFTKQFQFKDISEAKQVVQNDYTNIYYQYFPQIPYSTTQKKEGIAEVNFIPVYAPIGPKVPTRMQEYWEDLIEKERFEFDQDGNLITDGWTDKDFEKEWEKYKHLPLIDRRSGEDRRKDYNFDLNRPDRRKGEDRRKVDLFEEREKFLEKYKKHQERKKALWEQSKYFGKIDKLKFLDSPPVIQTVPYKEELEQIELPEPKIEDFSKGKEEGEERVERKLTAIEEEVKKEEISLPKINFPESISREEILEDFSKGKEEGEERVERKLTAIEEAEVRKEKEEISLTKINFPESISREDSEFLEIEFPEPNLQEQEKNFIPLEETNTISKVEIIEPNLQELFLPDPILPAEIPLEYKDEDFDKKEKLPEEEEQIQENKKSLEDQNLPSERSSELERQQLGEGVEELDFPQIPDVPETKGPVQEIRGVLELKPPDEEDAPFLTLTYDFSKIPDSFQLSKNYHTLEYVYYKYKPLLIKAQEFARRKMIKNALNYYRMIKSQNIPPEFKRMINRNIQDITDYIEKFMMSRSE